MACLGSAPTSSPNEDVLLYVPAGDSAAEDTTFEIRAVKVAVEMDHEGTHQTTYLVAGDELED